MGSVNAWLCDWGAEPDFQEIVDKSLSLFSVFSAVSFSFST